MFWFFDTDNLSLNSRYLLVFCLILFHGFSCVRSSLIIKRKQWVGDYQVTILNLFHCFKENTVTTKGLYLMFQKHFQHIFFIKKKQLLQLIFMWTSVWCARTKHGFVAPFSFCHVLSAQIHTDPWHCKKILIALFWFVIIHSYRKEKVLYNEKLPRKLAVSDYSSRYNKKTIFETAQVLKDSYQEARFRQFPVKDL